MVRIDGEILGLSVISIASAAWLKEDGLLVSYGDLVLGLNVCSIRSDLLGSLLEYQLGIGEGSEYGKVDIDWLG